MAGKADIQAGSAFVRLFVKDETKKGMNDALRGVSKSITAVSAAIAPVAAVAAAAGAGLAVAMKNFVSVGGAIDDMAARTGASTRSLQQWKFAAEASGATVDDLETALRNMAKNGMAPHQFEQLGRSIAAITDPGQRSAAAMEAFGKSGTKLLPMFRDLTDLKARSDAIGPVLTPEEVALAAQLGDSFDALKESLSRLGSTVAVVFGPQLRASLEGAIGMVASMADFVRELRNAKSFGSGGDLLDVMANAEWRAVGSSFEDFRKRGAAATAGGGAFGRGGAFDVEREREVAALGKTISMTESIVNAERKRLALMHEFLTPQERFLEKQNEIFNAIAQVNQNKVLNFISPEQAAFEKRGLEVALQRLRAAEMERRIREAGGMKPAKMAKVPALPEIAVPQVEKFSVSTFSAFAAMAMGNGGGAMGEMRKLTDEVKRLRADEAKKLRVLEEISRKAGPRAIAT